MVNNNDFIKKSYTSQIKFYEDIEYFFEQKMIVVFDEDKSLSWAEFNDNYTCVEFFITNSRPDQVSLDVPTLLFTVKITS